MDNLKTNAVDRFEQMINIFGFSNFISFMLFFTSFAVSLTVLGVIHVRADDSRSTSYHAPYSTLFTFMICLALFLIIGRHITVLIGSSTLPFDRTTIIVLTLVTLIGAIGSTGSTVVSGIAGFLVLLATSLRFSVPSSNIALFASNWFNEYFPYDVSPKKFAMGVITFIITGVITLYYIRSFNKKRKQAILRDGNAGIDPAAIEKVSASFAIVVGLILSMVATGVSIPTITLITGLLAAGFGFAAKDILSNIAAGVVLVWDGSFRVNDVISLEGGYGWIDRLTLRHAIVKDRNDISILIPYTILINSTIQNWTHDKNTVRLKIDIGIDYSTKDIEIAKDAILLAARRADSRVLTVPAPRVTVIAAGESAIQLQLRFWIADPKNGIRNVMSNVLERMIFEIKKANINIPFNTIDVNLRSHIKE